MKNSIEPDQPEFEQSELEQSELEQPEPGKSISITVDNFYGCIEYSAWELGTISAFASPSLGIWWTRAYPIIELIAATTGAVTGVATIATATFSFIKWVRDKLRERQGKNEYAWIRLILNEEEWNVSTLAQKLDLTEDETKKILKGFGYIWSPQKMIYISTNITDKLRDIDISV